MPGGVFLLLRVRNKEGAESMTHPAPGVPCKGPTAAHQMAGQRYKKLAIYRRSNLLLILSPARTYNALREPETRPLGSVLPKWKKRSFSRGFFIWIFGAKTRVCKMWKVRNFYCKISRIYSPCSRHGSATSSQCGSPSIQAIKFFNSVRYIVRVFLFSLIANKLQSP